MRVFESIPFRSAENVQVDAEPEREKGDKFLSVSHVHWLQCPLPSAYSVS